VNEHIGQLLKMGAAGINIEDSAEKHLVRSLNIVGSA
jgi:2-methylisocitrate lyase-like PEP mutase family enzyme